jgi:hypothetical protein
MRPEREMKKPPVKAASFTGRAPFSYGLSLPVAPVSTAPG